MPLPRTVTLDLAAGTFVVRWWAQRTRPTAVRSSPAYEFIHPTAGNNERQSTASDQQVLRHRRSRHQLTMSTKARVSTDRGGQHTALRAARVQRTSDQQATSLLLGQLLNQMRCDTRGGRQQYVHV
jgi:hypothetical protein